MNTGLVLEGGGFRGLFTAGVIDVWQKAGIRFDGIIGVSAGALFGCNYKSHQPGRAIRYNLRFCNDSRYMGLRSLLTTGNYVNTQFAYHNVPMQLDPFDSKTFSSDPTKFYMVCTDIVNGKPLYHQIVNGDEHDMEWFRATGSIPLMSQPVQIDGYTLLDGGMTNSIPLQQAQELGFKRNVVILTQPRHYLKKPMHLTPVFKLFLHRYPQVAKVMAIRHEMYNQQLSYIDEESKKGNTFLIYPEEKLAIGRIERNKEKLQDIYNLGQQKGEETLEDIRSFLNQKV